MAPKQGLKLSMIAALRELAVANNDSGLSFEAAASVVENSGTATLFREIGKDRRANADALQRLAVEGDPEGTSPDAASANPKAVVHRWWRKLAQDGQLPGEHTILCEAERSEAHIKQAYDRILATVAGGALSDLLLRQYRDVKRHHDQIRDLRERTARAAEL